MKKQFLFLAMAVLSMAGFCSCNDDDEDAKDPQVTKVKVVSNECSESLGTVTGRHKVYMDCTLDSATGELTIVIDSVYALEKPVFKLDSATTGNTGYPPYSCISNPDYVFDSYDALYLSLTNSGLNLEPYGLYTPMVLSEDTIAKLDSQTYNLYRVTIKLSGVSKNCFVDVEGGVYLGLSWGSGRYLLDPLRRYEF